MSTKLMTGLTLTALAALGLAAAHPAAAQTTVTSTTTYLSDKEGGPYDLTSIGTTDWINYGSYYSAYNQKAVSGSAVGLISAATAYGSSNIGYQNYQDVPHATWSDGSTSLGGTASSSGTGNGNSWAEFGAGQGFTYTVTLPGNSTDTVNLYVGGYLAGSDLQVSAGGTQIVDNKDFSPGVNGGGGYLSTTFSNPSASSQVLTYSFFDQTDLGQYSNVKLGSVTLASTPTPAAAPEPSQFASMGFTALVAMGLILKARKRRLQGEVG